MSERPEASLDETRKMKLQYLGDSKDAFKWDYLDFLVKSLNMGSKEYKLLVVPMLTDSDNTKQGQTDPSEFSSSKEVQKFCVYLQNKRELKKIKELSSYTNSDYDIYIHKEKCHEKEEWFVNNDSFRRTYFPNISKGGKTVLFLDPDKGFETKHLKNTKEHHVKYCDIKNIYNDAKKDDIIVVFQHAPHNIPFPFREKYKDIVRKLTEKDIQCDKTALFWCNQVMFVIIGKSSELINKIRKMNESYQKLPRPVEVIRGDAG